MLGTDLSEAEEDAQEGEEKWITKLIRKQYQTRIL